MEGNAAARVEKIMTQMAGKIALHWLQVRKPVRCGRVTRARRMRGTGMRIR